MSLNRLSGNCRAALLVGAAAFAFGCATDDADTGGTTPVGGSASGGGGQSSTGGAIPGMDMQVVGSGGQAGGGSGGGGTAAGGSGGEAGGGSAGAGAVVPPQPDASTPPPADAAITPPPADAAVTPPPGPDLGTGYVSCDEVPGQPGECFSNADCPGDRVCRNVGTDDFQVPCCVAGPRGDLPAGSPCEPAVGETTCASSICIDGSTGAFCSTTCQQAADCPVGMQVCQYIAFSTSEEMWCFPETPE